MFGPMNIATMPQTAESLLKFPTAFPIKVMGRTQDGFAQTIVDVVQKHAPDFDPATMEMRASSAGQVPVAHVHDQRDLARAARRSLPRAHVAPDGGDGAVMRDRCQPLAASRDESVRPPPRPHRVRADVARDAGVHLRADAGHARRDLADRASADLHAGTRRAARAPAARQRHPGDQGRSRRTGHLPRPGPARRVPAVRPATPRLGVRALVRTHRGGGGRMA